MAGTAPFFPEQILESKPRPEGFLAFGGGYRRCLGASYAVQELKYMIAIMASRLELELLDEQPLAYQKSGVITHPRRGTPVRVLSNASGLPKRRAVA